MNQLKLLTKFIIVLFLLTAFWSCTKIKSTEIGIDLIPNVDNINTFDTTIEINATNFLFPDSTWPKVQLLPSGIPQDLVAGHIGNDPLFGKSTASMHFQLSSTIFPVSLGVTDSLYLDSVVLCLGWNGKIFGDTNQTQKFDVYQLNEEVKSDTTYGFNSQFSQRRLLGSRVFTPNVLDDSVYLKEYNVKNQLRIRLSDEFGNEFFRKCTNQQCILGTDSAWNDFLKGLSVVPDVASYPGSNALMGFSLSDTNTYLRLYYRYDTAAKSDTTYKTFKYTYLSGFANTISRDYSGSELQAHIGVNNDTAVYLNGTPGTYAELRIPGLDTFRQIHGNVVVHKAELSMQQISVTGKGDNIFSSPESLYLDIRDSAQGVNLPILLDGFSQGSFDQNLFGGYKRFVPNNDGVAVAEYRFNLTRYTQTFLTRNTKNYPFHLFAPNYIDYPSLYIKSTLNKTALGRVRLGAGGVSKQRKMLLHIIYSKI